MAKFTVIYTDGYEEHYNISRRLAAENGTQMSHFKKLVEDDLLKLVIDNEQIALIPIANIRKILFQPDPEDHLQKHDFPGFIQVRVEQD